jgi:hypothetical protein
MKSYQVRIKAITPYMQHRMDDKSLAEWEKTRGPIIERDGLAKDDLTRAEFHCYRDEQGNCYMPTEQIRQALIAGGTYMKSKVGASSKSMKYIVASSFMIPEEGILLPNFDKIDKRSAVNRNVKARIIVIRPKWSTFDVHFRLDVREDSITEETIKQLFYYAGSHVGIGSYRPANTGLFGQFELVSLTPIK